MVDGTVEELGSKKGKCNPCTCAKFVSKSRLLRLDVGPPPCPPSSMLTGPHDFRTCDFFSVQTHPLTSRGKQSMPTLLGGGGNTLKHQILILSVYLRNIFCQQSCKVCS